MEDSPEYMVFQALQGACSQSTVVIKQAEEKLSQWEVEPGFYSILLSISSDTSLEVNVRWMAAVYFKNGVNKYWRKNSKNEIQQTEKHRLRIQLLSNFTEPIPQVAVQIAALIGKIARLDCPRDWPELIPVLLEAVRTTDELQQQRSLLILHHVIKALSSKRMMADKKLFEELTKNVYAFILSIWDGFTTLFFQSLNDNKSIEVSVNYIEKASLSLRIIRKLTIYGYHKPHHSEHCMMFLESIFRRIKDSVECRYELKIRNAQSNLIELTEKFILKQTKILNEFLEQHPLSFVHLVSTALEFSFNYVFHSGTTMIFDGNNISFTPFIIHCINLMKGILSSAAYSGHQDISYCGDVEVSAAISAKNNFFTRDRISYICDKVITHYFLLTQFDLDFWMEDPESFTSDEGGESWKYTLRPCTETFFLTLFNKFRQDMTYELMKYIRKAQATILTRTSDLKDILLKDAIYNAAGLSAFNLFDEVDFDSWFTNQLTAEIKINIPKFRIIRRRCIWLIGKWTGIKFFRSRRPQVYALCLQLLQQNEDMSVRLEASKTLMTTMDDFEFESQPFLPYLEPCFSSLFILLKEAKECDTKMNVLYTMSFIVDKMSDNIPSQADNLITYLPLLWKESSDHNMLRCAIISTLLQIVKALCYIPDNLSPFLYSVILISTDVNETCHVYLMEEGLELWSAVVENSTIVTHELLDLCKNLIPIIEASSENLQTVLGIIEAYILLSPDVYLQRFGTSVVSTCAYLLSDMRPEGIVMVLKLYEACLRVEPNSGINLLKPVLPNIFTQIYENKHFPMVMTMYLAIIARVLLLNQSIFIEALEESSMANQLERILDVWLLKMPLVSQAEKRKLLSLALSSIITVNNPIFYSRFPAILQNISECLNDIMREDLDGRCTDALVFEDEADLATIEDYDYKTYHSERCRQLCMKDPVHRIVLMDFLQLQIKTIRDNLGEESFKTLMLTVDSSILTNLSVYINIFVEIPEPEEGLKI